MGRGKSGGDAKRAAARASSATTREFTPNSVHDIVNELHTKPHELIPIHKVRSIVAQRYGESAASHAVFDRAVKDLRADGKIRTIAISDLRDATEQQLADSMQGMNETLFYFMKP